MAAEGPNPGAAFDAALEQRVADPAVRGMVRLACDGAFAVLRDLRGLDDALYDRLAAGQGSVMQSADPGATLLQLKDRTVGSLAALLARMRDAGALVHQEADTLPDDLEFDTVDSAPPPPASLGLDEGDIDGALGALSGPATDERDQVMTEARRAMATLGDGLAHQLAEFEERFALALAGRHFLKALEDLDDTRNSAGDGLFAMVSALHKLVVPGVDPETLVPGYESTLQRALSLRRALAHLGRVVDRHNTLVQDRGSPPALAAEAYASLRAALAMFLKSPVFSAMRPSDRWQLATFSRELAALPDVAPARNTCEGLAKYVDSLQSINQREALRRHDVQVLREIGEAVEAAGPLLSISLQGATSLVRQAVVLAGRLDGRNREGDALLERWRRVPPDLSARGTLESVIAELAVLVRSAGL